MTGEPLWKLHITNGQGGKRYVTVGERDLGMTLKALLDVGASVDYIERAGEMHTITTSGRGAA